MSLLESLLESIMPPMSFATIQFLWDLMTLFGEFFAGLFGGNNTPAAK